MEKTFEEILKTRTAEDSDYDYFEDGEFHGSFSTLQAAADKYAKQEWNKAINAVAALAAPEERTQILKLLKP